MVRHQTDPVARMPHHIVICYCMAYLRRCLDDDIEDTQGAEDREGQAGQVDGHRTPRGKRADAVEYSLDPAQLSLRSAHHGCLPSSSDPRGRRLPRLPASAD